MQASLMPAAHVSHVCHTPSTQVFTLRAFQSLVPLPQRVLEQFMHATPCGMRLTNNAHLAVLSALALTNLLPLASKATSSTSSVWPVFTDKQRPLRTSQSRAVVSMEPLSSKLPTRQQGGRDDDIQPRGGHAISTQAVSSWPLVHH